MLRLLVWIALIGAFVFAGSTIKLGNRTFFGHVRAIWHTEEAQDLKQGVKEKAAPAASRVKRGLEALTSRAIQRVRLWTTQGPKGCC